MVESALSESPPGYHQAAWHYPGGLRLRKFAFAAPALPLIQLLADYHRVLAYVFTEGFDPGI